MITIYRTYCSYVYMMMIIFFTMGISSEITGEAFRLTPFETTLAPTLWEIPESIFTFIFSLFDMVDNHQFMNETFGFIVFLITLFFVICASLIVGLVYLINVIIHIVCGLSVLFCPLICVINFVILKPIGLGSNTIKQQGVWDYIFGDPLVKFASIIGGESGTMSNFNATQFRDMSYNDVLKTEYMAKKVANELNHNGTYDPNDKYVRIMPKYEDLD